MKNPKRYIVVLHQDGGCDYMETGCGTKVHYIEATSEEEAMSEVMYDVFGLERDENGRANYLHGTEYLKDVLEVTETPAMGILGDMIRTAQHEMDAKEITDEADMKRREIARLQRELENLEGR